MARNQEAGSTLGISLCHTYFGSLYKESRQYDKATEEYETAYRLMKASKDEWHTLNSLIALADIYHTTGNDAKEMEYLGKAKTIAERIKSPEHLAEIHTLYYKHYKRAGDYRTALSSYEQATVLQDSVLNMEKVNRIQNTSLNIERNRQAREMNEARHKLEQERATRYVGFAILGAVLLALSGVLAIVLYTNRLRRRSHLALKRLSALRENFFTNITHEFRTPLTVILGKAEELQKATAASLEQQHTAGSMIVRQGRQLLSLVNQLLDISKVKSEVGNPDWHTGNVVPYLHMIVEGGQQLAKTKGITMLFMPKETEIVMDVVPDYLRKIMRNLIGNATKFTPQNGNITVSCERRDNRLCIQVVDDGIGISEESLKHLFEPFYQAESESANLGTGVGLSLVRQLVKAMQGEVSVQSRLGEGATFSILLPLKHGKGNWKPFNEETITEISFDKEPEAGTGQPTGCNSLPDHDHDPRTRVLIVEDNVDVARYIGSQMPSAYSLTYATNGTDGLQKALCLQPDLVITDLMMPGMDGLEMCRRIRANRTIGTTPVIVITAKTTQDDLEAGLRAGASAYLFKPFSASELRIRVEWILAERRMLHDKYQLAAQQVNDAKTVLSQEDKEFVSHFTNTIYNQLHSTEIDLDALADHLCMSRRTLQRKVNDLAGMSLTAYITKIRTDYARQLIRRRPEMPVSEVAQACGFSDRSYFDRMFKQSFGVTPAQYRRNLE